MRPSRAAACILGVVITVATMGLHTPVAGAQTGAYHFEQGVTHYRQGDYRKARTAFLNARDAGMDSPRLTFNLALTHYKLRDYAPAKRLFETLTSTPDFAAMAYYHLGLIEERRDRDAAAARRYADALERSDADSSLQALAEAGLGRTRGVRKTDLYVFAGGGSDDNPLLLNEDTLGNGSRDTYFEAFGFAGHRRGAGRFEVSLYARRYNDSDRANTSVLSAAIGRQRQLAGGTFEYRAEAATVRVDSEGLQEEYSARVDWDRRIAQRQYLDARLRVTRVEAGDDFDFLTGWRHRARLRTIGTLVDGWWRLGYRLEWNDRKDIDDGSSCFSRSPMQHRFRLDLGHPLPGPFSLEARASYRHSRYRDADRFTNADGGTTEKRRIEDRLLARLGARWRLASDWSLLLEYEYQHNSSSFDSFDYERNSLLLGVEWST